MAGWKASIASDEAVCDRGGCSAVISGQFHAATSKAMFPDLILAWKKIVDGVGVILKTEKFLRSSKMFSR